MELSALITTNVSAVLPACWYVPLVLFPKVKAVTYRNVNCAQKTPAEVLPVYRAVQTEQLFMRKGERDE